MARCLGQAPGSEDLATVGASAVLAARAARAVREVLRTAGRVGAGHQRGGDSLPLRATVPRVAARHLPLRNSHGLLLVVRRAGGSGAQSQSWGVVLGLCCSAVRPAQRGSIGASCVWPGSSASRAPHSVHNPGQSSLHKGRNGSASTTASRNSGSRSTRSSWSVLTSSSSSSVSYTHLTLPTILRV